MKQFKLTRFFDRGAQIEPPAESKRCLLFTRTGKMGGAEQLIDALHQCEYGSGLATELIALDSPGSYRSMYKRYDIIHSHLFLPGLLIRLRRLVDSSFIWIHSVHYDSYEFQKGGALKKWLDRNFIFPGADELVAVSESVAASLRGVSTRRITLIPNGVRASAPRLKPSALRLQSCTLVIGAIAMLRREKGLTDLIWTVHGLLKKDFQVSLRIAGEGPERKNIEELVSKLRISRHVELLGFVDDVEAFTNSIDIFVNCSKIESFGLATLEAMNRGVPLIATAVGETPNLLQNGRFGLLVDRDCSDFDFRTRLQEAIEIVSQSLGKFSEKALSGAQFHRDSTSIERFLERHRALYFHAIKPGVCLISPVVTHSTGGMQRQMKLQARELAKRGYQIFILQRRDQDLGKKKIEWGDVVFLQTRNFDYFFKNRRFHSFVRRLNGLIFVIEGFAFVIKNRHRFQILHAHQLFSPTTIGFLSKLFFDITLVVKVTASGIYGERNEILKLPFTQLRLATFKKIDSLIVLTQEMAQEMRALGFDDSRIALIPNSVTLSPSPKVDIQISKPTLKILYTGRLSIEKSIKTIIKAVNLVSQSGLVCELTIVGGASQGGRDCEDQLRNLAIHMNPFCTVNFTGHVEQVETYYQEADVFVLASISEGMSNSLLEAMSFGKACIVTDIAANLSIVTPEVDALTFPPEDAEQLAQQLKRISNFSAETVALRLSLGDSARRTIVAKYSVESVAERIIDLYQSIEARRAKNKKLSNDSVPLAEIKKVESQI